MEKPCMSKSLITKHASNVYIIPCLHDTKITEPYRARNRAGVRLHYIKITVLNQLLRA